MNDSTQASQARAAGKATDADCCCNCWCDKWYTQLTTTLCHVHRARLRHEAKERAAEAERAVEHAADLALLTRVYRRWSAVVVLQVSTFAAVQCLGSQSIANDSQP
jgi:hypothetical protein